MKLSPFILTALRGLKNLGPHPKQEFNPGVVNKLLNEGWVTLELKMSPYAKHQSKKEQIYYLVITEAGKNAIK